jgi:glycerol-3-phosphate O-acyltransferase
MSATGVETRAGVEQRQDVVVAYAAHTGVERELIERWVREAHPGAPLVPASAEHLRPALERGDDTLVVPVRVAWLPRERDGDRRMGWSDVLALTNPRRPRARAQARIVRREADRWRVIVGEPAGTAELRRRWRRQSGIEDGATGFPAWVARQAALACERAERAVIGDRYKVPRLVAEQITDSARFRTEVAALADRLELTEEEVTARAKAALNEMAAVQSPVAVDLFALVMSPLHRRAWDVRADSAGLERLRELNRRHALVFLPSHRSYADPLVLGQLLDGHGFPPNHTLGGANLSFWPIGPLARRSGLIFIRRSFRDDEIYKFALREYFGYLAAKRFNLEWYIEGGRSRTGKLRPPRYGLLRYLMSALDAGRADDVYLVPVAITYDQLPEVGAMAAEERGASKKPEGIGWLAGYARAQRQRSGTVDVRFGEPLSLAERMQAGRAADVPTTRTMQKVAFEVCHGINGVTPIVSTSVVTLALLGVDGRALTLAEVRSVLDPLLGYVETRELPVSPRTTGLRRGPAVRAVLDRLANAGVVTVHDEGTEPVFAIEPDAHHVAAFYRNTSIHWFVNRAILELAILDIAEQRPADPQAGAWQAALRLRELLLHEFFFADKREFSDQLEAETDLLAPDWRRDTGSTGDALELLRRSRLLLAHRVLRPFLESYLVVADRLAARDPREPVEQQNFIEECRGVGRQWVLQRRLHSPESVSRELFGTALRLARHRDLVDPGREELAGRRRAFLDEVAAAVEQTTAIARVDEQCREETLADA